MFGWSDFRDDEKWREKWRENDVFGCLVESGKNERFWWGPQVFSPSLFKIQSLQIREKIGVKSGKNIWTKMSPLLLTFLSSSLFFPFFWLFLSPVTLAFCFCFCFFLLSFFGFVRTWWVLLLFLFFFFLIFSFFFLGKHFWMISYAIFWNVHFHRYKKKKIISIMYYFLFYLRGTWW